MNCGGGLIFGGGRKTFRDKKSTGVGDFFSWGKKGGGGGGGPRPPPPPPRHFIEQKFSFHAKSENIKLVNNM